MSRRILHIGATCAALAAVALLAGCAAAPAQGQESRPGEGFAAVPGLKGGHDVFGPYDPVQKWPLPLASDRQKVR